jgi:TPR repeat protein
LDRCDIQILCRIACEYRKGSGHILRGTEYLGVHNHPTTYHLNFVGLGSEVATKGQESQMIRNLTATLCLTIAVLLGSAGVSWSADLKKGLTAYKSGDYASALREWTPLAKQGIADAQFLLGRMFEQGKGITKDYETAAKWYIRASKQNLDLAQNNLGSMYRDGLGVTQNYKTAIKWYKLAAEQGLAVAQDNLGIMHHKGLGVSRNYSTAMKWYKLAEKQGNASAQSNIGVMYATGQGVPQNSEIAVKWYRLASENGYAVAQHNLGYMYVTGQGVPQNDISAYMWWHVAALLGNVPVGKNKDLVATRMDSNQIEKAQDLARECVRKKYKGC